jgi:Xaa-Pro dipeptidase
MEAPTRRDLIGLAAAGSLGACAAPATAAAPPTKDDDPLFSELENQRHSVAPISPAERAARRARLGELLPRHGADALLCEGGATMRYLTGVDWGHSERLFGLVVTADGEPLWICPAFEEGRARRQIEAVGGAVHAWDEHEYAFGLLASVLRARGVDRVAIEPRLRYFAAENLAAAFEAARFSRERLVSGQSLVAELRGRKDAHEIALLRRANELTQQAIAAAAEHLQPGMTGSDVARLMRSAQQQLGLTGVWVLALVGPAAASPHGGFEDRSMEPGDVILVDTGGSLHGYQSDITRTWCLGGQVSADVERAWLTVRDAQRRAFEAMRPGVPCRDLDALARRVIAAAGYGEGYAALTHRLGHGIGMEGHEEPYIDGGNALPLAPGMTFSDEPGIYLEGRFGVRIEDIVVVTEDGADHFGEWQPGPAAPA